MQLKHYKIYLYGVDIRQVPEFAPSHLTLRNIVIMLRNIVIMFILSSHHII